MTKFSKERFQKLSGLLNEQDEKKYKYNTPEEFFSDYAMGGQFNTGDVAPHVENWAKKHKFDIPSMRVSLRKNKLEEQVKNEEMTTNLDIVDNLIKKYNLHKLILACPEGRVESSSDKDVFDFTIKKLKEALEEAHEMGKKSAERE